METYEHVDSLFMRCLCAVLARQPEQIDWSALTAHDWSDFLKTAQAHGVAPLLWSILSDSGWPDAMPGSVRHALHLTFYQTTAQNTLLYQELARILEALRGIPVVVLKGAALANTFYPHIGARPMVDIDLLVPQQKVLAAAKALRSIGYQLFALNHDLVLFQPHQQTPQVELHWSLVYGDTRGHPPPVAWFWEQTRSWTLSAQGDQEAPHGEHINRVAQEAHTVYQLTPTALLLYLLAHLVLQHGSEPVRLCWLYDLYLIFVQCDDQLDIDELIQCAELFGWTIALETGLRTMMLCLGSSCPPKAHAILSELQTGRFRASLQHEQGVSRPARRFANLYDAWSSLDWHQRLSLLPLIVFPAPEYLRMRYAHQPAWPLPLLYPYRWWGMAGDVLRAVPGFACQLKKSR